MGLFQFKIISVEIETGRCGGPDRQRVRAWPELWETACFSSHVMKETFHAILIISPLQGKRGVLIRHKLDIKPSPCKPNYADSNLSEHLSACFIISERERESGKAKSTQMHIKLHQIQLICLQNSVKRVTVTRNMMWRKDWGALGEGDGSVQLHQFYHTSLA